MFCRQCLATSSPSWAVTPMVNFTGIPNGELSAKSRRYWSHQASPSVRFCVVGNITYYVAMGFERDPEGELVALDPVECQSSYPGNVPRPIARRYEGRRDCVLENG